MAYTAVGALITAAMAHAPASTEKTAFAAEFATLQTLIQTHAASYSEAEALFMEQDLLKMASHCADALKDEPS